MAMTPAVTRVLFVCTANQCRSPFAEALARRAAGSKPIAFDSAGVESWRRGVPDTGLRHAEERGLDLSAHVSRPVLVDQLESYDVILGLSREHARELLALSPGIRSRLFTLKQFARWLELNPRPQGAPVGEWLDRAAAGRSPRELLGSARADDVDDPLGLPIDRWRAMSTELDGAIATVLVGLLPNE